ncbi:MAG TPA: hypothetical protein VD999_00815 [Vitreimonas sp.]|nr:hypothetical protein [Vitreimonas sp.]
MIGKSHEQNPFLPSGIFGNGEGGLPPSLPTWRREFSITRLDHKDWSKQTQLLNDLIKEVLSIKPLPSNLTEVLNKTLQNITTDVGRFKIPGKTATSIDLVVANPSSEKGLSTTTYKFGNLGALAKEIAINKDTQFYLDITYVDDNS